MSEAAARRPVTTGIETKAVQRFEDLPQHDCVISGRETADITITTTGETQSRYGCALVQVLDDKGEPVALDGEHEAFFAKPTKAQQAYRVRVCYLVTARFYEQQRQEYTDLARRVRQLIGGGNTSNAARRLAVKPDVRIGSAEVIEAVHARASERRQARAMAAGEDVTDLSDSAVQREVRAICQAAMDEGASDIHIDISPVRGEIYFRVDGLLEKRRDISADFAYAICQSAYNTMAESGSIQDQFNRRKYQNAVIDLDLRQGRVRLRFGSVPVAPNSVNVTLRLLPIGVAERHKSFPELGYAREHSELMRRAFGRASGVVIIAGTTGSGKSTTLKNAAETVATERPHWKLRSLEEPVEYQIKGCAQTPILRSDDEDEAASARPFAEALKACMRTDPDFILVGEVRDLETATLAFQAAQTGHQVATTLHTESWIGIVERLRLLGLEYGTIAQPGLLSGLVYQKLVPVLCEHCKIAATEFEPVSTGQHEVLERLATVVPGQLERVYMRGPGCPSCRYRGTTGRTICAEVALPNSRMLNAIRQGDMLAAVDLWRAQRRDDADDMTGRWAGEHAMAKMRAGTVCPFDVETTFRFLDEIGVEE